MSLWERFAQACKRSPTSLLRTFAVTTTAFCAVGYATMALTNTYGKSNRMPSEQIFPQSRTMDDRLREEQAKQALAKVLDSAARRSSQPEKD